MVQLLLDAGAKLLHKDEDGTALDNAMKQKRYAAGSAAPHRLAVPPIIRVFSRYRRYDCVELLDAAMEKRGGIEALENGAVGGEEGEEGEAGEAGEEGEAGEAAAEEVAQAL